MVTTILFLLLSISPDPSGCVFEVRNSVSPVTVTVGGTDVKPGTVYTTEPGTYEVTVRYHGPHDEWVIEKFVLVVKPGTVRRFSIRVPSPPMVKI